MADSLSPWTAARQASLSFTISQSWLKLMDWSIPVLIFWSCSFPCDTNFEFGEKTCLVCLNNTLAPSSLWMGHLFLKLFLAPLHLLACNTCHYRKSVSYTVIPKRLVPACGECGVWGRGVEERVRRPVSQKAAWLSAEPTPSLGTPIPRAQVSETWIHIQTLFSILM